MSISHMAVSVYGTSSHSNNQATPEGILWNTPNKNKTFSFYIKTIITTDIELLNYGSTFGGNFLGFIFQPLT